MQVRTVNGCVPQPMGKLIPRCKLCDKVPPRGLVDGHFFSGLFICRICEDAIVKSEVGTTEYDYYIEQVKKLWD